MKPETMIRSRVLSRADLQLRLQRVENAAAQAQGSAGRADALLVAFAARRSIVRHFNATSFRELEIHIRDYTAHECEFRLAHPLYGDVLRDRIPAVGVRAIARMLAARKVLITVAFEDARLAAGASVTRAIARTPSRAEMNTSRQSIGDCV